jgi:RimJ/RimL family protein N-acetyltransferase
MPNNVIIPRVITGETVDLISPFPFSYLDRLVKWSYQYKSLLTWDYGPQTQEEMYQVLSDCIQTSKTYGVVDKYNKIGVTSEGPVVIGAYMVDEVSPVNYHVHTVSQRRAWGKGLMDEGLDLLVEDLFSNQNLLRLSATMVTNNRAVINFATRHGFKREGIVRDIIICNGEPRDVAYYGLTRKDYFNAKQVDPVMQE